MAEIVLRIPKSAQPDEGGIVLRVPKKADPADNEAAALSMIQSPDPADQTAGMSTTQKALAGAGKAFSDVYQGLTQLESRLPSVLQSPVRRAVGLTKQPEQIDAEINETRRLDAPLMNTTAGKVGNVAGNIAVAAPTAFIPGVNTTVGAGLVGASQGFIQPVAEGDSRALNTVLGGVLGAGGQKVGQAVGNKISSAIEARKLAQAQNAGRDSMLAGAKEAGYVVPPSSVNPSALNSTLEGLAGKIKTGQLASQKNQNVTNSLVRKALGVADDQPITPELLTGIRRQAGEAYEAIKGVGRVQADDEFFKALDDIAGKYQGAAKDFPELADTGVLNLVENLKKADFDAGSAIDLTKVLRESADKAYRAGDKGLGAANKRAADAIEGVLERHLERIKAPGDLLVAFREARQAIAKTYSVESALNKVTGNIDARKLAKQLEKGKPLTGSLKQAAEFAGAFPKAAQEVKESMPAVSPLDFIGSAIASAASGNPSPLLWLVGRPAVRSGILSAPYQSRVNPSYGTNALARLVAENPQTANLLARSVPVAVANSRE